MANLLKEITHYGDGSWGLGDELQYCSDRTVDQYKKMRVYPMCWMGLKFIKLGLSDIPFVVECEEDEEAKMVTEAMFKQIWKRMFVEGSECLDFGFKAMELRYKPGKLKYYEEDKMKTFEGILLKEPKGLDGETIKILTEPNGSFKGFQQNINGNEVDVLVKDRKPLVFVNDFESGNYYGISAQESIYPYWYDANLNRQFHMRYLERKGTGILKGYYPDGKTTVSDSETDNQDVMLNLLDGIMEGTVVAIPSATDEKGNKLWEIEYLDMNDKTNPFIERANYLDQMILRGLVIPEKALTQGEIGSRASVESFQNMFVLRRQAVLDDIVDSIDRYVVPHWKELNFDPEITLKIKPGKIDDDSKELAEKIAEKLVDKGVFGVEQQWLIDKTGIPLEEPEEEEEEIPEETPEEISEEPVEEDIDEIKEIEAKENGEDKKGEESDEIKDIIAKDIKIKEGKLSALRWRPLTAREEQCKLAELSSTLDQLNKEFQEKMKAEVEFQIERISRYLDKNYGTEKVASLVKNIVVKKGKFRKHIREFLEQVYDHTHTSVKGSVEGRANLANTDTKTAFLGFRTDITGSKFIDDLSNAIKYQVSTDISSGLAKAEMLERLGKVGEDYVEKKVPLLGEVETGFTLDKANYDYRKANKKLVAKGLIPKEKEIQRVQFSAIMDDKVCELCAELDGLIVPENSPVVEKYQTPIHYNCRCFWLPITKEDIDNPAIEDTDLTTNKKGKPMTVDNVTAKVGDKIDLKTFCCLEC